RWKVVPSPDPSTESYLNGITALSSSDLWAVGYQSDGAVTRTLTLRWQGSGWYEVPSAATASGQDYLRDVWARSADDAWAVGYTVHSDGRLTTLTEKWDGSGWSVVQSEDPSPSDALLAVTGTDLKVLAAGDRDSGEIKQTLVESFDRCSAGAPERPRGGWLAPSPDRASDEGSEQA